MKASDVFKTFRSGWCNGLDAYVAAELRGEPLGAGYRLVALVEAVAPAVHVEARSTHGEYTCTRR